MTSLEGGSTPEEQTARATEYNDRLTEARRIIKLMRDEPGWALSRIQRAAELEARLKRERSAVEGLEKELKRLRSIIIDTYHSLRSGRYYEAEEYLRAERATALAAYRGRS